MRYSDGYLQEFLPGDDPPRGAVPDDVQYEIASWIDRYLNLERRETRDFDLVPRATRWTYAVFSELWLGNYALERFHPGRWRNEFWLDGGILIGGHQSASFGLFDEQYGASGLGIIIDVPFWPGPPFLIVDYATFPRLRNVRFPIALRQSEIDLHLFHPQGATTACWAQCNQSQQWGFLTAGHAVSGNRPGRAVPMEGGVSASLARSYYQPVDAAFVLGVVPNTTPPRLPVMSFPAVGMDVDILCRSGGQRRTVVQVTNNLGVLNTRSVGIYVYLDMPASPGDSGALVRAVTGDAVGIYSGKMSIPGPPAGSCGLAQNFEQAILALNVTPYL